MRRVALALIAFAGAVALIGCGGGPKSAPCVPTCDDATSCWNSCGGVTCPCPTGDVCVPRTGACRPCVAGSCEASPAACVDECGNPDTDCAKNCEQPDMCVDDCGVANSPACAGAECDPDHPGNCRDTCGQYAAACCCVPRACANVTTCADDCENFNPSACRGQQCGAGCYDTCGEPDSSCWVTCTDPTNCLDDCGDFNPAACSGVLCNPNNRGFDTCNVANDGC
jgi:hypothetical protein